jgi:hypothetical protein
MSGLFGTVQVVMTLAPDDYDPDLGSYFLDHERSLRSMEEPSRV